MLTSTVSSRTPHSSTLAPPRELLERSIVQVLDQIERRATVADQHFANAAKALNALPLATADFGQAINNLRNARAYLQAREWGAAKYELVSFRRRLPRFCDDLTSEVQRTRQLRPSHL
jgi:hypothetical protein